MQKQDLRHYCVTVLLNLPRLSKPHHRLFVIVYTVRESTIRIISARKANQREVKEYEINTSKDR